MADASPVFCRKKIKIPIRNLTKYEACADYTRVHDFEGLGGVLVFVKDTRTENIYIPQLCRQRLLQYAESFKMLAKSMEPEKQACDGDVRQQATDRHEVLEQCKDRENQLLISHNLWEVAQIMTGIAEEMTICRPMEDRYRKVLVHALRAESIYADKFCYLEEGKADGHLISMELWTSRKSGYSARRVADMLSVLLRRKLQPALSCPDRIEKLPQNFIFAEESKYVVLTGFCKVTKEEEQLSGDHYSILETEKGKLKLLLSDGTGSGERASRDSERVLDLTEKLLESGYQTEVAMDMVNVSCFGGEGSLRHPTLDICDLDLYTGECRFCKVGGAESYILRRDNQVEKVRIPNFPLGIFRCLQLTPVKKELADSDYVIMITDGVQDAYEAGGIELEEVLSGLREASPERIAERIINQAICCCGGHVKDDMTVLVAGIWENAVI